MTTSSTNYTGLYSGNVSSVIPNTAYGNANVVGLLATSTDGANTIGNISATGNVAGNYFLGNGSQLTGITGTYGNANVVTLLAAFGSNTVSTTGNVTAGNILTPGIISATGNITTAGYFIGTFAGNISGNLTVPGSNTQVIYNNSGNAGASAGFTFNSASNVVTVTGNIVGGNITTAGNVTGNYILGNGSQLTGLPATYGNANVVSLLAAFGSNAISTTGNVTADYVIGNGSLLTNITGANVSGQVANALVAGTVYTAAQPNITSVGTLTSVAVTGNTTTGNMLTGGVVSATGNITGNYIIGNGSQLTGLPAGYSNADVATFLAAFGSNAISTTGNVTASYLIGNGSLLTNLTAGNITGQVANALVAGTVYTNAQPNITSVGTLTSATVTGNITGGNILTGGIVSATGNITGNVFTGNGSGLTDIPGGNIVDGYGNANVSNFLANGFGSNTITTTGNITGGNVLTGGLISATGTITGANITGSNMLTGGVVSAVGNITGANILTAGLISAGGNITGNYFLGNGSQLSGLPGQTAGSDQQIQYNNAGAFAGNVAMTFDQTAANVTLSNLIIGTSTAPSIALGNSATRINTSNAYSGMTLNTNGFMPGQIVIGNGFFGNLSLNNIQARPTGKFVVWDSANIVEASGNTIRYNAGAFTAQISISNITSGSSFFRGGAHVMAIGGGPTANSYTATTQGMSAVVGGSAFLAAGQPNTVAALGNVTLTGTSAGLSQNFTYAGSNVGNAAGHMAQISAAGNVTTGIGVQVNYAGTPSTTPTNTFAYYMPGTTGTYGSTNSNGFRQATNYYFLRNDDNVAQNQLGSLRAYHEFQAAGTATGTWNIDKSAGQVQAVSATGNITIGSYTNFVTTANDGTNNDSQTDTVTLIIEQGATPYTVTMPTGNAAIRYAANVSTVSNVANTTTMVAITAYRTAANATGYLTTISPGFV